MANKFGKSKDWASAPKCPVCGAIVANVVALTRHQVFKHGFGR